tara:strand:- start:374 stop:559 length:186 start_codon:yes stop_codon:yes gene_type:complete
MTSDIVAMENMKNVKLDCLTKDNKHAIKRMLEKNIPKLLLLGCFAEVSSISIVSKLTLLVY